MPGSQFPDFLIIGKSSGVVEGRIEGIRLDDGPADRAQRLECFSIRVPERVRPGDKFFIFEPVPKNAQA